MNLKSFIHKLMTQDDKVKTPLGKIYKLKVIFYIIFDKIKTSIEGIPY